MIMLFYKIFISERGIKINLIKFLKNSSQIPQLKLLYIINDQETIQCILYIYICVKFSSHISTSHL